MPADVTVTRVKRSLPDLLDEWAAARGATSHRAMVDGRLRYFVGDVMLSGAEVLHFMDHHDLPGRH